MQVANRTAHPVSVRVLISREQALDQAAADIMRELAALFVAAVDDRAAYCLATSPERGAWSRDEAVEAIRSRLLAAGLRIPEAR